ncbi:hypothetical protein ACN47E_005588 [Coniothyrium glycines]
MLATHVFSSDASLPGNSYIYKIISTAPRQDPLTYSRTDSLAFISSDDSLRFVDAVSLKVVPHVVKSVNEKVTCLERANDVPSNVLATAGRDGFIRFWDKRSKEQAIQIESPHKLISSLVCDTQNNFIAAGIENPDDGPGVSPVYVWDQRNLAAPLREYVESHTDTVTSLQVHPSHPSLLLSSSTDGLINIFDTTQADEDDALYQVINHRSAIAHAGFVYPSTDIYALGTDETVSFYALQSQKEEEEEPTPKAFGDVREVLGCEYLVNAYWSGAQPCIAAGKHSDKLLALVPLTKDSESPLAYDFDLSKSIQFTGAHGEEIVRDLFTDVHSRTTFTCGEDGFIRAWKHADDESMDVDQEAEDGSASTRKKLKDRKEKRKDKKDKKKGEGKDKERFKPY